MMRNSDLFINFLLSRRSIRKFDPREIDTSIIMKILDIARYAPSSRNKQPWIFIVVTDKEIKSRLARLHKWSYPLDEAPVGIVVACDKELSPESYQVDCANTTIYIMLAAHAMGLGSVWINTFGYFDEIRRTLDLPEKYVPIAMLAMGYPAEKPEPRERKSLSDIVFLNKYRNRFYSS
mgnify:CR=1 FL=1